MQRYVGHDAPGDGHQGICKLLAAISGLKYIASMMPSTFGPATRVTSLTWLPKGGLKLLFELLAVARMCARIQERLLQFSGKGLAILQLLGVASTSLKQRQKG